MKINKRKLFVLAILLFALATTAFSQDQGLEYQLKGKLEDAENGESIPFAHVTNLTKGIGVLSDSSGLFKIPAREGDSLQISSVSYGQQKIVVPAKPKDDGYLLIRLAPNVYELEEVVISRFPSERRFKEQLLTMDIPKEEKPDMRLPEGFTTQPAPSDGNANVGFGNPVTALASKFSKKERSREFVAEMKAKDERKAIIHTKFNREVVQRITGLEDEDKLEAFKQYCVLTEDFLFLANEYEIHEAVLGCFKEFEKEQG